VIDFLKRISSRVSKDGTQEISEAFVSLLTKRNLSMLAESLFALTAALAMNIWLDSSDPLGVKEGFPWIWMVPASLHYVTEAWLD
jgi:hypothetical protein